MIAWTIEVALNLPGIDRLVVSTEDEEIAKVAVQFGAEVPFIRPADLAGDAVPGLAPVLHALEALPGFDRVLLLQPTSPLRSREDILGCFDLAERHGAPSVISVCQPDTHPQWMYYMDDSRRLGRILNEAPPACRQDLPTVYAPNGAIYLARTTWLMEQQGFVGPDTIGFVMPPERSVDIDTPLDWMLAEMLLEGRS